MSYREAASGVPLVTCLGGALVALDPVHGHERWAQQIASAPLRVLVSDAVVFVVFPRDDPHSSRVRIYDLANGTVLREVALDFAVRVALARSDLFYFAGYAGLACFAGDGQVRFRYAREIRTKSAWNGDTFDLVLYDGRDRELSRRPIPPNATAEAFLALGELVAQPDFDS